jgi:hypothetical protein
MAESTPAVICPAGEWTLISDGNASISFQWRDDDAIGRWTFSDTTPAIGTADFVTLRPKQPANINQLSSGARIWVLPEGTSDRVVETIIP